MFLNQGGQLSLQQKGLIIALSEEGRSRAEIAVRVGCHRTTIERWQRRYNETLDVNRQRGSGRPRKTTPAQDMMLVQAVQAKPITSSQEIIGE